MCATQYARTNHIACSYVPFNGRRRIKFAPPELRSGGVEAITDALAEVNVVAEKVDTADGVIALRVN